MTISSTIRKAGPFSGTGAQVAFPFAFKVFATSDLRVVLTDATGIEADQVLTSQYTVFLNADQNTNAGGTVTMLAAPAAGYKLTITSAVLLTQGQSIPNNGGFYPKVIENALDKLTIVMQQLAEQVGRSVKFAISDTTTGQNMPPAAQRAGNLLGFDGAGNMIAVAPTSGTATALQSLLSTFAGSSLIGFIAGGIGAIFRTVQDKLRDSVDVRDFGAKGDGVTDDTLAIQRALTAVGGNRKLRIPTGTYLLTATLNAAANQIIEGDGPNNTILRRFTDYGDTLSYVHAGSGAVRGIWLFHGTTQNPADTSLTNLVVTPTAHIRAKDGQGLVIEDCWMWRMPYQIVIEQGSLFKIRRCNMQGTWDNNYPAAQEGIAAVLVGSVAYTQIVAITECYFGGSGSGPRNVVFSSTDTGAHTFSFIQHSGNKYAIQIKRCEDLLISENYMGGNASTCIYSQPVAGSTNLDWRISNNFIDGAGDKGYTIWFSTEADGTYPTAVTISGNVFNGELQTLNGIFAYNAFGAQPVLTDFTIVGNSFQAFVGSGIMLYHAQGGTVSGNSITGYNARNVSAGGDVTFVCGVFAGASSKNISITANTVGGAVNSAASPSYCYRSVYAEQPSNGIYTKGNIVIGSGLSGLESGRLDAPITFVTATANYAMASGDELVIVNRTSAASTQVTFPPNVPPGHRVTVKDGKGDAAANPTQMVGTVDGVPNPVYNINYFAKTFIWNGAQWNVVG